MVKNIAYLANDIGRLFRKRLDVFSRPVGITGAQVRVLLNIRRNPGINQSTLASILEVEPITAGRMIDRMTAAGLVERRADPDDRRAWRIHLTDEGSRLLARMDEPIGEMLETALAGMDSAERDTLEMLLGRVHENLVSDCDRKEAVNG
ncbi:MarR family winged helix-turn-helix transcriptional regulator [Croceicoccus sediminis]|uniref:MarR family winged helix-turn-helix transcriptional regulator n=1 Tax=Croceicoccus sediminis TaxID=2571150 RepID=UPI001183ACFC|nr:MarR family transcriptional regulator [Croceicoccus sediminis]